MSHFTVLVIYQGTIEQSNSKVEELLAPYDEQLEVPEYETSCGCVDLQARTEAREAANKNVMPFEQLRQQYWDKIKELEESKYSKEMKQLKERNDNEGLYDLKNRIQKEISWEDHIKSYVDCENQVLLSNPKHDLPDLKCTDCDGTGKRMTTYNPKSKWDWYAIGGRWSGKMSKSGSDVVPVEDIKKDFVPFAIVDSSGVWHEKGNMGWFAIVVNEKDEEEWKKEVRKQIKLHLDEKYISVLVDCHI